MRIANGYAATLVVAVRCHMPRLAESIVLDTADAKSCRFFVLKLSSRS